MKLPNLKVLNMKNEHGVGEGIGCEEVGFGESIGSQEIGTGTGEEYEGFWRTSWYHHQGMDMSAYELAVIYGYKKSYEEWLIDLLTWVPSGTLLFRLKETNVTFQRRPWNTKWYRFKTKCKETWHSLAFCAILTLFWLLHVLIFGWFQYCFKPRMYIIKARYILDDIDHPKGAVAHDFWWSRYHCEAAKKAAAMNEPESYVQFTERVHPFFLDSEIFYVKSKGYKARWINEKEKLYSQAKWSVIPIQL